MHDPAGSLDENDLSGLDLGSLGSLGTLVGQPPGMGPRDVLLDARGPAAAAATAGVVEQREQPQQQPQPQPLVAGSQDVGAVQEADARVVVMDTTGGGASSRIGAAAAAAAGAAALGLGPGAGVMAQGPPPVLAMAHRDVFHVSRGTQRSIGSMMVVTPMGKRSREVHGQGVRSAKREMHATLVGVPCGLGQRLEPQGEGACCGSFNEWHAVLLMVSTAPRAMSHAVLASMDGWIVPAAGRAQ